MNKAIITLFEEIAKPFKDKEGGPKLDAIQEWLNKRNISNEYIPGIGKIVNQIDNPRIILVSHIDLIRKFQKGFADGITHEIIISKKGNEIIKGALDNTITNAVALLALESILKSGITDIELVLTEGEEVGCIGMDSYLKSFEEKSKNAFIINLDVTNEGWKQHSSVEYDKPSFNMLKQLQTLLAEHDAFFTVNRVGDDIDAVNSNGCSGFSYCLPTKDLIHSYENKAYVHTLEGYYYGLISLLNQLELFEDMKDTFSRWDFNKALKSKSFEEFTEITKKEVLTLEKSSDVYQKKSSLSENLEEKENLIEGIIHWLRLEKYSKEEKAVICGFVEMNIMNDESFTLEEFANCYKHTKTPMEDAKKNLSLFLEFGSLEELGNDTYRFVWESDW